MVATQRKVGVPKARGSHGGGLAGPEGSGLKGGRPKISRSSFSRRKFRSFFFSSRGVVAAVLGHGPTTQIVRLGLSGVRPLEHNNLELKNVAPTILHTTHPEIFHNNNNNRITTTHPNARTHLENTNSDKFGSGKIRP